MTRSFILTCIIALTLGGCGTTQIARDVALVESNPSTESLGDLFAESISSPCRAATSAVHSERASRAQVARINTDCAHEIAKRVKSGSFEELGADGQVAVLIGDNTAVVEADKDDLDGGLRVIEYIRKT